MLSKLEENKATATKFLVALSATEDFKVHTKGSSVLSGTHDIAAMPMLIQRLTATLPNGVNLTIIDMIAESDRVVCEARGEAVSATGKPYNNNYAIILQITNGRVESMTEYLDTKLVDEVFT